MGVLDTFSHWYLSKIRYNVCQVIKYVMKSTTKKKIIVSYIVTTVLSSWDLGLKKPISLLLL